MRLFSHHLVSYALRKASAWGVMLFKCSDSAVDVVVDFPNGSWNRPICRRLVCSIHTLRRRMNR